MKSNKSKPRKPLSRRRFLEYSGAVAGTLVVANEALGLTDFDKQKIVRAEIHPAIGVARIGNSEKFYIGPEVICPVPMTESKIRDAGALCRQAARFRIYGFDANDRIVGEITPDIADIQWNVHLANKKAAWYRFVAPLDIEESSELKCIRRNKDEPERSTLVIDPGPRTISGRDSGGTEEHRFSSGNFRGFNVSLGELRTDEQGHLLVLSGLGKSESPSGKDPWVPSDDTSFNNAEDWYDDTSDGPVTATITIDGRPIKNIESAWVVIAPPNYAPDIIGWRTMYDLMVDTYTDAKILEKPTVTSFEKDILPLLKRLADLQWVNNGYHEAFGPNSQFNFNDNELLKKLSAPDVGTDGPNRALRISVYEAFRKLGDDSGFKRQWPMLYGDTYGTGPRNLRTYFAISEHREAHLARWRDGRFISEWNPEPKRQIEDVRLEHQPHMLTEAAMQYCLADAFHPGCELTWPMRVIDLYEKPFRIKRRIKDEDDLGPLLTKENVVADNGPLKGGQAPGDLTRWMALPWQGDTVWCRSGYDEDDPYMPTFWPARVPNHVLSADDYRTVVTSNNSKERNDAFNRREKWWRHLTGSGIDMIQQMMGLFGSMGVVLRKEYNGDGTFPKVMYVEDHSVTMKVNMPAGLETTFGTPKTVFDKDDPLAKQGWENQEQKDEFLSVFKHE